MAMDMLSGRAAPPGGGAPDLAALLGAGGQTGPPAPDQPQQQAQGDPVGIVQQMLGLGKQYLDVEPDHEDLLTMQKVLTSLQQLLTKDQQDADQAMSGSTNPRALRKAFGG